VPSLVQQRRERALEFDRLLRGLFTEVVGMEGDPRAGAGLALVAVGGYGRSELSPSSDLDVVLLHDASVPEERVREVAEAIWYPLWDQGVALDHSVRDTVQMREAALLDHRAATGMLDARAVAGDAGLVLALRSEVLADWRRDARRRLAAAVATAPGAVGRGRSGRHLDEAADEVTTRIVRDRLTPRRRRARPCGSARPGRPR